MTQGVRRKGGLEVMRNSGHLPVLLALFGSIAVIHSTAVPAQSEQADLSAATESSEGGFFSQFIDPLDGRLDLTAGGDSDTSGFVPLLIPGNDPTFGPSLLAALVYFHEPSTTPEPGSPPTMTFGGAGATENHSWGVAGGHSASWNQDRVRYLGGLGYVSVNLDYYGLGSPDPNSDPLGFNIEGAILVQQAQRRLGDSDFFFGGRYMLLSTDVGFDISLDQDLVIGSTDDAGVTAFISYDTRDNTFTPNEGTSANVGLSYFSDSLGGDFNYSKFDVTGIRYWRFDEARLTLGLRAEYHYAEEDAPFYSLPWVSLRGIPILRYLGNHAITAEIEPRFQIDERWSVLGFAGFGRAAAHFDDLSDAEPAYNYGVGFRYLLARRLGLAAGFDLARGPEDTTLYLTFGNAWVL